MRIGFLLGAGVSQAVEMPSTDDITGLIFPVFPPERSQENEVWRHINRKRVTLLETARDLVIEYYSIINSSRQARCQPNYEEVYSVLSQVENAVIKQHNNPALGPMIKTLKERVVPVLPEFQNSRDFNFVLTNTNLWVRETVIESLDREPTDLDRLNSITAGFDDQDVELQGFFTTNHDIVIDSCLKRAGREYVDGFGPPDDNLLRHWNQELLYGNRSLPVVLKLHGAINWRHFRKGTKVSEGFYVEKGQENSFYAIPERDDFKTLGISSFDSSDGFHYSAPGDPIILIGTVDKMFRYNTPILSDVLAAFGLYLRKVDALIVSGYGFGDVGINYRVANWFYSFPEKKIIIIHKNPEKLKNQPGFSMSDWDDLVKRSRIVAIYKKFEETTWDDIKGLLLN